MVDVRFVMDHHPCVAIGMTAGEVVLKAGTATDAPVIGVPRIGAFQNGVQVIHMERTVDRLLIAARLTADPRTDHFRIDSRLIGVFQSVDMAIRVPMIVGLPLIVTPQRAVLQATVFQNIAPEILARLTVGLPSTVAPPSIAPQTGLPTVAPLKVHSPIGVFLNDVLKIRAQRIVGHLLIAGPLIAPMESVERVLRNVVVRAAAVAKGFLPNVWTTNLVVSRVHMPRRLWPTTCSGGAMPPKRL